MKEGEIGSGKEVRWLERERLRSCKRKKNGKRDKETTEEEFPWEREIKRGREAEAEERIQGVHKIDRERERERERVIESDKRKKSRVRRSDGKNARKRVRERERKRTHGIWVSAKRKKTK